MISRAVYARSVCLRCQLRLLDRPRAHSLPRLSPFRTELLQRRSYSSQSAWDRLEAETKDKKQDLNGNNSQTSDALFPKDEPSQAHSSAPSSQSATVEQDGAPSRTDTEASASSGEPKTRDRPLITRYYTGKDPKDHRERRRVGSRSVYLQSEQLEVNMLGEKARTIIMREMGGRPQNIRQLAVEELLPEEVDIRAKLEAEEQDLSMEEALANMDEIRPTDPIVSQSEFDALLEVLVNGFTVAQLRTYLNRANSAARPVPEEKQTEYDWIEDQRHWRPLQYIEVVGSPKERLSKTLLKEAWRLEVREMLDGQGIFATKIKERFLALLAKDNNRLAAIREAYLDSGESIELAKRRVKILATKAKTETILKKLDEAAQDVVEQQIQVDWFSGTEFQLALLEHLGRLTNTYITYDRDTHNLRASWFKDGATEEDGHERLDHVVQRLLYAALYPRDASVTLKYDPKDKAGRLVAEPRGQEKLSWKDKLTQWSRWVKPAGRSTSQEHPFALKASNVLPRPVQSPAQDSDAPWSKPYTSTTASFGHILHMDNGKFSLAAAAKSKSHIFSPSSPPPASLAVLSESLTSSDPVTTTLVLGFRPHPSCDKKAARDLPGLLELHLTVPDDIPEGPLSWEACPKRLVAVLGQNFSDVAYPSGPVDLRISQPSLVTMSSSALDASPFREYIESAKLDLLEGRLRPPPEIELSDLPSAKDGSSTSKTAKYMFAGLEMRRTLNVEYEGHKLLYTSVEAGQHGGRRSEMVLEAAPADASLSEKEQEAHAEKYLGLVQDLAGGKVVKWVGERDVAREFEVADETAVAGAEAEQALEESEPDAAEEQSSLAEKVEEEHDAETAAAGDGEAETSRQSGL